MQPIINLAEAFGGVHFQVNHNIITIQSISEFGRVGLRADIGSLK
jgi:hypothetical protein